MICQELSLDWETLGTDPNTVVISIGACFFDIETGTIGETFYRTIDVDSQVKDGRTITGDTLKWWMGQADGAKKVFAEDALPIRTTMLQFEEWLSKNKRGDIKPWGNGATFDVSIAENLFKQYEIKCPWIFWNVNDLRTFRRFVANNEKVPRTEGIHHNALSDAINQAKYVIKYGKK